MTSRGHKIKYFIFGLWMVLLLGALYLYFFDNSFLELKFKEIFGSSVILGYIVFLLASSLRGFTLIPVTYFIVIGIILLPPWPLYIITMVGVLASSASIYYFSEYLNFDEYFEAKHSKQIERIKGFLAKNELPIVIGWSFMPFLPTDLICYVCGSLEIDIRKFLLGVFVGEGISCAIYIFLGKEILSFIG